MHSLQEYFTEQGDAYYYNRITAVVQWERPSDFPAPESDSGRDHPSSAVETGSTTEVTPQQVRVSSEVRPSTFTSKELKEASKSESNSLVLKKRKGMRTYTVEVAATSTPSPYLAVLNEPPPQITDPISGYSSGLGSGLSSGLSSGHGPATIRPMAQYANDHDYYYTAADSGSSAAHFPTVSTAIDAFPSQPATGLSWGDPALPKGEAHPIHSHSNSNNQSRRSEGIPKVREQLHPSRPAKPHDPSSSSHNNATEDYSQVIARAPPESSDGLSRSSSSSEANKDSSQRHLQVWNRFFENAFSAQSQLTRSNDSSSGTADRSPRLDDEVRQSAFRTAAKRFGLRYDIGENSKKGGSKGSTLPWYSYIPDHQYSDLTYQSLSLPGQGTGAAGAGPGAAAGATDSASTLLAVALRAGCLRGDLPLVQQLLLRGAAVGGRDEAGRSALHYAAKMGDAGLLALLVDQGGGAGGGEEDIAEALEAGDKQGRTPLHIAALFGQAETCKFLLQSAVEVDPRVIHVIFYCSEIMMTSLP